MPGMRENRVKKKLQDGKTATIVTGLNSPDVIEFFGQFGFDGMWIETEHAPTTWDQVTHQSRACDLWGITSVCSVTTNDTALITRTLDAGCTGIAVPHIRTRDEAEKAAKSAKFAPVGYRGMGVGRQSFGVADYYREANEQTLMIAFIEDIEAVDNLPEILTVENIDVFMVAPADLAAIMGYAWRFATEPAPPGVQEAIDRAHRSDSRGWQGSGAPGNRRDCAGRVRQGRAALPDGLAGLGGRRRTAYQSAVAALPS